MILSRPPFVLASLLLASSAAMAQQQPAATAASAPAATSVPAAAAPVYISAKLNRQQLDGLLTYADQVLILDVRRPEEITRIGGFGAYLNIQASELEANTAFIPRDRTLITVSNHASRALKAADALLAKGYKVAGAVGAQDYEAEGGKLAKYAAPVRDAAPGGGGQKQAAP